MMIIEPIIKIGKNIRDEINGKWNLPGSFSFVGKSNTPPQTSTKANKVAMLVKSSTNVLSVNKIGTPTTKPVTIVANDGV